MAIRVFIPSMHFQLRANDYMQNIVVDMPDCVTCQVFALTCVNIASILHLMFDMSPSTTYLLVPLSCSSVNAMTGLRLLGTTPAAQHLLYQGYSRTSDETFVKFKRFAKS